jgi:hypothetical protein
VAGVGEEDDAGAFVVRHAALPRLTRHPLMLTFPLFSRCLKA